MKIECEDCGKLTDFSDLYGVQNDSFYDADITYFCKKCYFSHKKNITKGGRGQNE